MSEWVAWASLAIGTPIERINVKNMGKKLIIWNRKINVNLAKLLIGKWNGCDNLISNLFFQQKKTFQIKVENKLFTRFGCYSMKSQLRLLVGYRAGWLVVYAAVSSHCSHCIQHIWDGFFHRTARFVELLMITLHTTWSWFKCHGQLVIKLK